MKSLLLFTLILLTAGNLYSQSEKPKEKPQEKPREKTEEPPPPPITLEVKEVWSEEAEGVDETLVEPVPPAREHPDEEQPFSYVEQMPTFPEGHAAMYKFIADNITYPEIAKQEGISGQVIVQFVILSDGTLSKAKVVRGIGGGCNEEALRVVNAMPKWNPGKHNGRPVPVSFTLPIKFVHQ